MTSRSPDRVPGPPLWLPACKVIALRLARSARPGGPSASDTSTSGTDCIVSTVASVQVRALVNDFAEALAVHPVGTFEEPEGHQRIQEVPGRPRVQPQLRAQCLQVLWMVREE